MTQADLAEISGVGLRNLKDLEAGSGNPTLATLTKALDALGFELDIRIKM